MGNDWMRRLFVTVSAVVAAVGVLLGSGLLGQEVNESTGGALSDEATLIAPAGPAFSIWSVIYAGLAAYVIWQWLPRNASTERERAIGWWVGVSLLLNGGWLFVTQADLIWGSVAVILGLAVSLGFVVRGLAAHPDDSLAGRIIVDGTHGLHLGTLYQRVFGPRLAVALALAWAFTWIAVGRGQGEPPSTVVLVAAVAAAAVTLLVWLLANRRHSTDRNPAVR